MSSRDLSHSRILLHHNRHWTDTMDFQVPPHSPQSQSWALGGEIFSVDGFGLFSHKSVTPPVGFPLAPCTLVLCQAGTVPVSLGTGTGRDPGLVCSLWTHNQELLPRARGGKATRGEVCHLYLQGMCSRKA